MATIAVTMSSADSQYTFALMRLSATTHSVNNDVRRIPLKIQSTRASTSFELAIPGPSIAIPGTYFLFAMNGKGVPSIAATVVLNVNGLIRSDRHSGLCVDVAKASQVDDSIVVQWYCSGATNQQFRFEQVGSYYRIKAGHSGKCLSVKGASQEQGAAIVQLTCADRTHQLWTVTGSGSDMQLKVRHSGMCLNINYASKELDAPMIQYTCQTNGPNDLWKLGTALS